MNNAGAYKNRVTCTYMWFQYQLCKTEAKDEQITSLTNPINKHKRTRRLIQKVLTYYSDEKKVERNVSAVRGLGTIRS